MKQLFTMEFDVHYRYAVTVKASDADAAGEAGEELVRASKVPARAEVRLTGDVALVTRDEVGA